MATVKIENGAFCGATRAVMEDRGAPQASETTLDVISQVTEAILTANAALDTPMADGDNAEIGQLVEAVTYACMKGRSFTSIEASDYAGIATQIVGIASSLAGSLAS